MKYLDRMANLAIIIAVAVFLILVARGEFHRRAAATVQSPSTLVGKNIRLPGIHFPAERDSLVLGISTTCHFCNESLPFYKHLSNTLHGRLDMLAVLPQTQIEASRYLADAGLSGVHVVSADLASIGVYATPTLLLVDRNGKVKSAWVGKQDDASQGKILAVVLPNGAVSAPSS